MLICLCVVGVTLGSVYVHDVQWKPFIVIRIIVIDCLNGPKTLGQNHPLQILFKSNLLFKFKSVRWNSVRGNEKKISYNDHPRIVINFMQTDLITITYITISLSTVFTNLQETLRVLSASFPHGAHWPLQEGGDQTMQWGGVPKSWFGCLFNWMRMTKPDKKLREVLKLDQKLLQ